MEAGFRHELPVFSDLQSFLAHLDERGEVVRVEEPVSTVHEATEIHRRVIAAQGPVLRFAQPIKADGKPSDIPLVVNLFGTVERVAAGLRIGSGQLSALGEFLASLRHPTPPRNLSEAFERLPELRAALTARPDIVRRAASQAQVRLKDDIDLGLLPIQTCWPGEPAPLITWPVVITRPPDKSESDSYNLGIYRMQWLDRNRTIIRWLPRRGGDMHHRAWKERGEPMPVAVAIGTDPALLLAATIPIPENVSEYAFAGALRGARSKLVQAMTVPLLVPAEAEIILEGWVEPNETAAEGPYGDHTGYYNAVAPYPVFRLSAMTYRNDPVYLSTFTGRAPDEPSVLATAMVDVFLPMIRQTFPEIVDCWLLPEACSYRIAVLSIRKSYPGQARRIMMGLWSILPQFAMTKIVIVVDDDIDPRSWPDVTWAMSTRMDPGRDIMLVENTPMDPLDFASPEPGLAGKLGIDATVKIGVETKREWGRPIKMSAEIVERVSQRFSGLFDRLKGTSTAEK